MAQSLPEYALSLEDRKDLIWPSPPQVDKPTATPHVKRMPHVKVVSFSIYGTLLSITGGQLYLLNPKEFLMEIALDKTIQEFKMWHSMSRKPGKPSEYMAKTYRQFLEQLGLAGGAGEKHPEVRCEDVWHLILKRLTKNDYTYDASKFGSEQEYCEKISYFFHANMQGCGAQRKALQTVRFLKEQNLTIGLLGNGQCFTQTQLLRALQAQGKLGGLAEIFDPNLQILSCHIGSQTPSTKLFGTFLQRLEDREISAEQVLHVGCDLEKDIYPAKRVGMHTALFAGDKSSLVASQDKLNDKRYRPDLLITKLRHLIEIIER